MAKIFDFVSRRRAESARPAGGDLPGFLDGFSIEVMPRTADKIDRFADILPQRTRVYVAHIDGTPIEDMTRTAARLRGEGFAVMPHLPARSIPDRATLADWLGRYADLGVDQALVLGGGRPQPAGDFHCARELLETGLFEARGFRRIHVAGHPEGNRDVDPDGGERAAFDATLWKQSWARERGVEMALATQFCFEAAPVIAWTERLTAAGIDLPVHVGVAGPAKLQTLIKFALACGVGPSLQVLQRRAGDITKLMTPFTPEALLRELAAHKAADPGFPVETVHFFPLGGIGKTAEFCDESGRSAGAVAALA